ncbi:MarR family transcriptional regulator [Halococcoides cellulosivorans]|uniref:ArsR family transcriptional regulator n=1 Tax=Halococcoides cellulosivorans TaxID=1679096 RepID=A0A2R4X2C7_9EURY|nr:helix-turn-helix domain-containing protein [Halococcoides cellulosivorans]AWB27935.1 ArsR family transcriptional regulator [Halococcoides cellulosivorans]
MSTTPQSGSAPIDPFVDESVRECLRELPPSAKLVTKVLDDEGPLSKAELVDRSLLPDRTVRDALDRLEAVEMVESRRDLRDARRQVYSLVAPAEI